jgi:hypothetical protein
MRASICRVRSSSVTSTFSALAFCTSSSASIISDSTERSSATRPAESVGS